MAALTTDHLCMWFGTNASVPSGWTKYASADDRCFQGAEASLETAAGSDSHTHTTISHVSGENTHLHSVSGDYWATAGSQKTVGGSPSTLATLYNASPAGHNHPSKDSESSSAAVNANTTATLNGTENHLPPTTTCILIHPTTGTKDLPDDASVFLDDGSLPSGFTWHDGVGVAMDLTDEFVKGVADATATDGGGSTGQTTHTHTTDAHIHAGQSHTHGDQTAGEAASAGAKVAARSNLARNHHTISLLLATAADTDSLSPSSDATTVEPPYVKLMAAQNTSGGDNSVTGMIVLYKGASPGSVTDWDLCDGAGGTQDCDGKFIKVTNTSGDIGNTGGTSIHQHVQEFSHTHTFSSHNHTVKEGATAAPVGISFGFSGADYAVSGSHITADHTWTSVAATPTAGPATKITTLTSSHLPKNITLAFLKYAPPVGVKVVTLGGPVVTSKRVLAG